MSPKSDHKKVTNHPIANNRRARYDYILENHLEAGVVLEGWEVKSIRAGHIQLSESYVIIKHGEAWWLGGHINPLLSTSSHVAADPTRSRKLLLRQKELDKLYGAVQRKGYTIVPISLYWNKNLVKMEIATAKGKKTHDKREAEKAKSWKRDKDRLFKNH